MVDKLLSMILFFVFVATPIITLAWIITKGIFDE